MHIVAYIVYKNLYVSMHTTLYIVQVNIDNNLSYTYSVMFVLTYKQTTTDICVTSIKINTLC